MGSNMTVLFTSEEEGYDDIYLNTRWEGIPSEFLSQFLTLPSRLFSYEKAVSPDDYDLHRFGLWFYLRVERDIEDLKSGKMKPDLDAMLNTELRLLAYEVHQGRMMSFFCWMYPNRYFPTSKPYYGKPDLVVRHDDSRFPTTTVEIQPDSYDEVEHYIEICQEHMGLFGERFKPEYKYDKDANLFTVSYRLNEVMTELLYEEMMSFTPQAS